MSTPIRLLAALAALGTLAGPSGSAQSPSPAAEAPKLDEAALAAEFEALGEAFEAAQQEYYKRLGELYAPFREREPSVEEMAELERKVKELEPLDPTKSFAPRYASLAVKAKGTVVAAKAWLRIVSFGGSGEFTAEAAIATLLAEHLERPELAELASALAYTQLPPELARTTLATLRTKSPHDTVKAAATHALAMNCQSDDVERAKELFRELVAKYAALDAGWGGTFGEVATRALFELERLQIGMVAPDFEASDENGVKFKVSDYRGKVVVLDFWGFW